MAVASAVMTGIHTWFGCDAHQAECRRMQSAFQGLAVKYESVLLESDEARQRKRLVRLDQTRGTVKEGATVSPPLWCSRRAETHFPSAIE